MEIWADYRDFEENLLSAAGADEKALQVQRAAWHAVFFNFFFIGAWGKYSIT